MRITIAGAGIVGCAIAYELATRGADVHVVDPRGIGRGATHASAGILAPTIEEHAEPLRTLCLRSLEMYDRFIERVRTDSEQPLEYDRSGTLQVARDEAESDALQRLAGELSEYGVAHSWLHTHELVALAPEVSSSLVSALLVPLHGYVRAAQLTEALAAAAERRGARFSTQSVRGIEPRASGARVLAENGAMDADAVVIAAGSWSGELTSAATHAPVKPIRGQLLQLRTAPGLVTHIVWGTACYLVPWRDGTVLAGATVEDVGFDERATVEAVAELTAGAIELVPGLAQAGFETVRVGLRPVTRDELPVVGRSSTHAATFYAMGHYRNGVLLAPLTASLVADLVLDGREAPELAWTNPGRFGL